MTQEEKAKAYDEAIERAKRVHNGAKSDKESGVTDKITEYTIQLTEAFFTELKGSKDERIKEWLINLVKGHIEWLKDRIREQLSNGQVYGDELVKAKNSLAWLEKQGEQKPAELSNTCEFSIKTWINIVAYVLKEHNGIGNYLDDPEVKDTAEKLQKRYKFDSASEEWDRVYRKGLDAGVNKGKAIALREKNHAWSEEDKTMVEDIIEAIDTQYAVTDYNEMVNWLKSLKDRYTWKPSELQIEALAIAIRCGIKLGTWEEEALKDLIEQLKKLREG